MAKEEPCDCLDYQQQLSECKDSKCKQCEEDKKVAIIAIQKLEKKALVSFIYIGQPVQSKYGNESRIQLNNSFSSVADIQAFVAAERQSRNEADRKMLTTSLKVDGETKMGVVTDVKQELRKASAFKINYSTRKKGKVTE